MRLFGIDNLNDYYDVNLKLARLAELDKFTLNNTSENAELFRFIKLDLTDRENMAQLFAEENLIA